MVGEEDMVEITFTIGEYEVTALQGMTWGEFIESSYNQATTDNNWLFFSAADGFVTCVIDFMANAMVMLNNEQVKIGDLIKPNNTYEVFFKGSYD